MGHMNRIRMFKTNATVVGSDGGGGSLYCILYSTVAVLGKNSHIHSQAQEESDVSRDCRETVARLSRDCRETVARQSHNTDIPNWR